MLAYDDWPRLAARNAFGPVQVHHPKSIIGLPADVRRIRASEAALLQKHRDATLGIPLPNDVRGNVAEKKITLPFRVHPNRAFDKLKVTSQLFDFSVLRDDGIRRGINANDLTKILRACSCTCHH